jgi:hypothetical protein
MDNIMDMKFRSLSAEEEKDFIKWAVENYDLGTLINSTWHPVVQRYCYQANKDNGINYNPTGSRYIENRKTKLRLEITDVMYDSVVCRVFEDYYDGVWRLSKGDSISLDTRHDGSIFRLSDILKKGIWKEFLVDNGKVI